MVVLGACCLINLCLGSIYAWSVFSASMSEYLSSLTGQSITSADLAIVYTVANSVGPITMITGGWFNDKFGPKKVLLAGTIMYSIGLILSRFCSQYVHAASDLWYHWRIGIRNGVWMYDQYSRKIFSG